MFWDLEVIYGWSSIAHKKVSQFIKQKMRFSSMIYECVACFYFFVTNCTYFHNINDIEQGNGIENLSFSSIFLSKLCNIFRISASIFFFELIFCINLKVLCIISESHKLFQFITFLLVLDLIIWRNHFWIRNEIEQNNFFADKLNEINLNIFWSFNF